MRNLSIRGGWQQEIVNALGGMQPLAGAQRTLPHVEVHVSCYDRTHTVVAEGPSLNPRFGRNSMRFESVGLANTVTIKVGLSGW